MSRQRSRKHDKRMQRLEDKCRREHLALRKETVKLVMSLLRDDERTEMPQGVRIRIFTADGWQELPVE